MRGLLRGIGGLLLAATLGACASLRRQPPSLLFLTDFGTKDGAVAVCKGVMWGLVPGLRIADLTHESPRYDVEAAADLLHQAVPYYPAGTVVVAVVDPGVGGRRKGLAARTRKGHLLVGPDNGIFTAVLDEEGLERAVELRETRFFRRGELSRTFHGRDVFAPVGAHLAAGTPLEALGPPLEPVRLELRYARVEGGAIVGEVRYIEDPYGNVVTNAPAELLGSLGAAPGDSLEVELAGRSFPLPLRATFSDVPAGEPLALVHERGFLSFSINQGDFAAAHGVRRGDPVRVRKKP
ncbi:MAG: SAM-dependent chlorinase/fluorinase [Elusimicrobia bacterium]|nr:SAM-dependent chlorinase/fluorinase [Elusimicrobiota bacterium]